jgi:hypothetical protein
MNRQSSVKIKTQNIMTLFIEVEQRPYRLCNSTQCNSVRMVLQVLTDVNTYVRTHKHHIVIHGRKSRKNQMQAVLRTSFKLALTFCKNQMPGDNS